MNDDYDDIFEEKLYDVAEDHNIADLNKMPDELIGEAHIRTQRELTKRAEGRELNNDLAQEAKVLSREASSNSKRASQLTRNLEGFHDSADLDPPDADIAPPNNDWAKKSSDSIKQVKKAILKNFYDHKIDHASAIQLLRNLEEPNETSTLDENLINKATRELEEEFDSLRESLLVQKPATFQEVPVDMTNNEISMIYGLKSNDNVVSTPAGNVYGIPKRNYIHAETVTTSGNVDIHAETSKKLLFDEDSMRKSAEFNYQYRYEPSPNLTPPKTKQKKIRSSSKAPLRGRPYSISEPHPTRRTGPPTYYAPPGSGNKTSLRNVLERNVYDGEMEDVADEPIRATRIELGDIRELRKLNENEPADPIPEDWVALERDENGKVVIVRKETIKDSSEELKVKRSDEDQFNDLFS